MDETATGGSTGHRPSALNEVLMSFDLGHELDRLRGEPGYRDFGRSSVTLGKSEHVRLVMTAARQGAVLGGEHLEGALAIQVLVGQVTVGRSDRGWTYPAGTAIWISKDGPWSIECVHDAALLLMIGWPGGDKAGLDSA